MTRNDQAMTVLPCIPEATDDAAGGLVQFIERIGLWSVNPYRRCDHACLYCLAGSQGESVPWYPAASVVPSLRADLRRVPTEVEIFLGAQVDAYPAVERTLGITRLILRELVNQERPVCINTKSDLVTRDLDLLLEHPGHCDVFLSLCSLNDELLARLEPGAPTADERLRAVDMLMRAGVDVSIDASPWIPGITDAGTIVAARPVGVAVQFAPLDLRHTGGVLSLLGHRYTQPEVNDLYLAAHASLGDQPGVSWKTPLPSV